MCGDECVARCGLGSREHVRLESKYRSKFGKHIEPDEYDSGYLYVDGNDDSNRLYSNGCSGGNEQYDSPYGECGHRPTADVYGDECVAGCGLSSG